MISLTLFECKREKGERFACSQQPKTARLGLRVGLFDGWNDWQIRYREELKELEEAIPKSWEEFAEKAEFCDILEE